VHTLRLIWQRTFARIAKPFKSRSRASTSSLELEREVTAATRESKTLAAELQRILSESEQARSEQNLRITSLDEARQEAMTARAGEAKQRVELERRIVELETECNRARGLVKSLEVTLADTSTRLDTMDHQVRQFQNVSRVQVKEFETSLSLALTRQQATDIQLKTLQDTSQQQIRALESSQADTSTRLETTGSQVRTLEKKLDLEHQLYLHTVREIQSQVRSQDLRLNWTMMTAVFAMLLGTVAGGILIWDVQKNAGILSNLSMDLKQIGSAMEQAPMTRQPGAGGNPDGQPNVVSPERHDDPQAHRAVGGESLIDR
jgi:uncharacterized coiled-coil protein SlyX